MSEHIDYLHERKSAIPGEITQARGSIMQILGRVNELYQAAMTIYPLAREAQISKGRLHRRRLRDMSDPREQYFALFDNLMAVCDELDKARRTYRELGQEWESVHRSIAWHDNFPEWIKTVKERNGIEA
jgi:hypothetical protein